MMQRKHPSEAMTGAPGALPSEAIRPAKSIVAAHGCDRVAADRTPIQPFRW
jgi:hypothetical protein